MIVTYGDIPCITDLHVVVLYVMENLIFDKSCTDHVNRAVDLMRVRDRHFGGDIWSGRVADVEYDEVPLDRLKLLPKLKVESCSSLITREKNVWIYDHHAKKWGRI